MPGWCGNGPTMVDFDWSRFGTVWSRKEAVLGRVLAVLVIFGHFDHFQAKTFSRCETGYMFS